MRTSQGLAVRFSHHQVCVKHWHCLKVSPTILPKKSKVEKREHTDKSTYLFVFLLMDWLLQYLYSLHAGFFYTSVALFTKIRNNSLNFFTQDYLTTIPKSFSQRLSYDKNYTYDKNSSLGVLDTTLCDKVCQ